MKNNYRFWSDFIRFSITNINLENEVETWIKTINYLSKGETVD